MGPRPAHPRLRGRGLHVHRADHPEPARRPDLRALRAALVDHRRRPRARPDHRPDHLGGPGGPAGGDRRDRSRSSRRSCSTLLVQQVENNFFVPKIQGDAIQLHPAAVIFAIIIGGALAGLLGAILALPDDRGLPRRRALPLPATLARRAGGPGGVARARSGWARPMPRPMPDDRPVQDPAGRLRGRGRGDPGRLSPARPQISSRPGTTARRREPDGRDQCGVGADR